MKPDKKVIKDINQEIGVTAEQLHNHCKYMLTTMPLSFNFSREERYDVINKTVYNVYKQMNDNNVNNVDYIQFKDYLFISLKSQVLRIYNTRNTKKYKFNSSMINIDDLESYKISPNKVEMDNIDYEDKDELTYQRKVLYNEIKKLTPAKQSIIMDYINEICPTLIGEKYGIHRQTVHNVVKRFKDSLIKSKIKNEHITKELKERKKHRGLSNETKIKMSNGRIGKHHTEETKQKISETLKNRYKQWIK